jgi:hypothetical protein
MKIIKLSDSQIRNANIFLERVELRGIQEAIALIELYRSINSANECDDASAEENATPKGK